MGANQLRREILSTRACSCAGEVSAALIGGFFPPETWTWQKVANKLNWPNIDHNSDYF